MKFLIASSNETRTPRAEQESMLIAGRRLGEMMGSPDHADFETTKTDESRRGRRHFGVDDGDGNMRNRHCLKGSTRPSHYEIY
jgi:hypothetical protein